MSLVSVSTVKGAPGGTTCALLLARALASVQGPGAGVLLVECDPAGGDLAPRLALRPLPGLASLALASRHGVSGSLVGEHSQAVAALPGVRLLAGVAGPEQGRALAWIFSGLADLLAGGEEPAVVDTGRIRCSDEAMMPFLRAASASLLVLDDSVASLLHARSAVDAARADGVELSLVVAGTVRHATQEIATATGAPVVGSLRHDPKALASLLHPSAGRLRGGSASKNPLAADAALLADAVAERGTALEPALARP